MNNWKIMNNLKTYLMENWLLYYFFFSLIEFFFETILHKIVSFKPELFKKMIAFENGFVKNKQKINLN